MGQDLPPAPGGDGQDAPVVQTQLVPRLGGDVVHVHQHSLETQEKPPVPLQRGGRGGKAAAQGQVSPGGVQHHAALLYLQIPDLTGVHLQRPPLHRNGKGGYLEGPPQAAVGHGLGKVLVLHRLDKVVGAVEGEALAHKVLAGGKKDQLAVHVPGPEGLGGLNAGDAVHVNVHKHQIEPLALLQSRRERFSAGKGSQLVFQPFPGHIVRQLFRQPRPVPLQIIHHGNAVWRHIDPSRPHKIPVSVYHKSTGPDVYFAPKKCTSCQ